ncbi:hypothetical protein NBH00_11450 [Paraconexibacter antarcticus]|uniref:Peptidase C-terminal archaeal/bacterial domain-containing protein n=1 Tax=Paraconexibacter antarcticus TaxID=2949664 RepID=A0ABY5E0W3_9ACTN|nr:hypothetical protein [Paraconexibacter antarcticus]UTI66797.1 hypothetical protein NBH00_11450 [Paraconexibacter antarcticus]
MLGASAVLVLLASSALAAADVGGVPADTIATGYGPIGPGTVYDGRFVSETDVDYLLFDIPTPGTTYRFDLRNTVSPCLSLDLTGCPVYASLLDLDGGQLGGEGSGAGSGPVTDDYSEETFDWTFPEAGRYVIAMDSGGDDPTYAISYDLAPPPPPPALPTGSGPGTSGGSGGGGGNNGTASGATGTIGGTGSTSSNGARGTGAAVASFTVAQAGSSAARARVTVRRPLDTLRLRIRDGRGRTVATAVRRDVPVTTLTVRLALDARARRALTRGGHLALRVSLSARTLDGTTATARRTVLLRAR